MLEPLQLTYKVQTPQKDIVEQSNTSFTCSVTVTHSGINLKLRNLQVWNKTGNEAVKMLESLQLTYKVQTPQKDMVEQSKTGFSCSVTVTHSGISLKLRNLQVWNKTGNKDCLGIQTHRNFIIKTKFILNTGNIHSCGTKNLPVSSF